MCQVNGESFWLQFKISCTRRENHLQVKDLLLDEVLVSALTKVTSVAVNSLDYIEVKKKWQEVLHYLRGKITAEELGKRFWKIYVPEIKVPFHWLCFG